MTTFGEQLRVYRADHLSVGPIDDEHPGTHDVGHCRDTTALAG